MTCLADRESVVADIRHACQSGARLPRACEVTGIALRTYRRWVREGVLQKDGRADAMRPAPANKLSEAEREAVLDACHEPRFASLPPSQIVPILADEGVYLASESSFYRILHAADEQHHRGRAQAPVSRGVPTSHEATGPNQVWCWDITYLPSPVRGLYFYLYLILDVYSRKIVGWEVHERECGIHASTLLQRTMLAEGLQRQAQPLVLHSDNGSPMKSSTLLVTMQRLGVTPSRSRPRVSNDNPYAESIFRTFKYRPGYPVEGFADVTAARIWVQDFERWYNLEHRHSGLKFVTPAQRHRQEATDILVKRTELYEAARSRNPSRWSKKVRDWSLENSVWLNPEKATPEMANAA